MSVPDSIHPSLLQSTQNDICSSVGGTLLSNSIPSGAANLNNFVAHNDIKLIASASGNFISPPGFPPPASSKKAKSSAKSAVGSTAQPSQMRYIIGNSTNNPPAPSAPCRSPGLAMVTPANPFVGALVAPGTQTATNAQRQTIMIRPTVSASSLPLSQASLMPINHGKPGAAPLKEENAWPFHPGNNVSRSGLHSSQTVNTANTATRVVPIRPGPSLLVQNQSSVSVIRPILSPAGLQQNHGSLSNNIGQSASGIVRQPSPQFVSYASAVRPMLFMDPSTARFAAPNGAHTSIPNVSSNATAPSPVSLFPSTNQISAPTSGTAKVFPKSPIVVKEKPTTNSARKRDVTTTKPRKPGVAKIKQEQIPPAAFSSSAPVPKNSEALLNGVGLAPHIPSNISQKRSPEPDDTTGGKKKLKKKHPEGEKPDVPAASVLPLGALSALPPGLLSEVQSAVTLPLGNPSDNGVPDLVCRDTMLAMSPPLDALIPNKSGSAENGAFRKKTRLMLDSANKKLQQNNYENSAEPQQPSVGAFSDTLGIIKYPPEVSMEQKNEKKPRRPRKPREKPSTPRVPKAKKPRPVITTTKVIPKALNLKHTETGEQHKERLSKLARKYFSLPEDQLQWLAATKSANQLKLIRWLRLVDGAYVHAESAKSFEKMERLRDQKIHAIMDLEKLQAPFQPRLIHFLHPDDVARKNSLLKRLHDDECLTKTEVKWLKEHYDRLCNAEASVASTGSSVHQWALNGPQSAVSSRPEFVSGNGRVDAGSDMTSVLSTSKDFDNEFLTASDALGPPYPQLMDFNTVHEAHQYIRKFPDSTKAMVEMLPDGMPCAVVLLFQLPNSKAVHIKKKIKVPEPGFPSVDDAFKAAELLLDRLVAKYLGLPSFPVHVRYPVVPGTLNDTLKKRCSGSEVSRWNFSRDMHGWETVQYIDGHDLQNDNRAPDSDHGVDADKPSVIPPSLAQNYRQTCPLGVLPSDEVYRSLEQQIQSRVPIDLTSMANDPMGQRMWLSWECRQLSQQYFDLDANQKVHEAWGLETASKLKNLQLPETSLARVSRLVELMQEGVKKPKSSSSTVAKTIRLGEQVRDVLDSFKKERPMTRRKRAAVAARSQLMER